MCGRYVGRSDKQRIAEHFRANPNPEDSPLPDADYNVALTTTITRIIEIIRAGPHLALDVVCVISMAARCRCRCRVGTDRSLCCGENGYSMNKTAVIAQIKYNSLQRFEQLTLSLVVESAAGIDPNA